jgi:predicted transcriptional regulator
MLTVRVSDEAVDWINDLAAEYNLHRSQVLRCALMLAKKETPAFKAILHDAKSRF